MCDRGYIACAVAITHILIDLPTYKVAVKHVFNVTGTSGTFDAGTLVACNLSAYAAAGNVSAASGPTVFSYSHKSGSETRPR